MLPRWLVTVITLLITCAWVTNVIIGFLSPHAANADINAVFAVVVGAAVALRREEPGSEPGRIRRWLATALAGRAPENRSGAGKDDEP